MIKLSHDQLTKAFEYLERLRESGRTNMWLAPKYLIEEHGLDEDQAKAAWSAWMDIYDQKTSASDLANKALKSQVGS